MKRKYKIIYEFQGEDHILGTFMTEKFTNYAFSFGEENTLIGKVTTKALEWPHSDYYVYRLNISRTLTDQIKKMLCMMGIYSIYFIRTIKLKGKFSHGDVIMGKLSVKDE